MGYRSDVFIAFAFENDAAVTLFSLATKEIEFKSVTEDLESMTWGDIDGVIIAKLNIESVKWYPSYPEVIAFDQLFGLIESEYKSCAAVKFIRVGEDAGDVEENTYGNESLLENVDVYTETSTIIVDTMEPLNPYPNPFASSES